MNYNCGVGDRARDRAKQAHKEEKIYECIHMHMHTNVIMVYDGAAAADIW